VDKFLKYFPLVKVDEAQRIVYGLVTAERVDKDGEICHYESTVPQYKAVNDEMGKATDGANIMPLREMHQLHAVGAGKSIEFDDAAKQIKMAFKVVEDSTWKKVMEKVLTGFSQGGKYIKRWKEGDKVYYTAEPSEVSLVDNPCLAGAVIEYAKADGSVEKFNVPEPPLARLTDADINRIAKSLADSILSTQAKDLDAALAERMRQLDAGKGEPMNKEQIAKCAAALGITPEEFTKQFVEGDALEKGKKGLAALHAHLKKAHSHHTMMHAHHDKIATMHKAHGEHHATMADHLDNCMKAHGACMDDGEADKVLKALGIEIKETEKIVEVPAGMVKVEDMTKAIADAIKAATEPLTAKITELEKGLAPNNGGTSGARLALVGRDGKELSKAEASDVRNPMAVS
jgi:hypothetical protein